ncbi:hypothetical protein [Treponema endosymbiont of Eucomonympha sp.]|uniref:hypothetical protein n=1 Tax=Treponema endosymbiont of Eucomonympha sp. TaxID=1580831 RepID=UPI0007512CCA|nr:hypothetical protein [Treponema endosymbiont of Eucomonympha sp.]
MPYRIHTSARFCPENRQVMPACVAYSARRTFAPSPAVRLTDNAEAFHALASLRSVTVREAGTDSGASRGRRQRQRCGYFALPRFGNGFGRCRFRRVYRRPENRLRSSVFPADKAAAAFSYALEISSWTYSRIMELFE